MSRKKSLSIGLALGGGGARGIAHIPMIQILDEMGIKPVIISGTSMGAIIGALFAAGVTGKEMEETMNGLSIKEIGKMVDVDWLSRNGLVKGKGIVKYLSEIIPANRFEDLQIPLQVVATDFWNRSEVVFSSGDLLEAVRASISIPGIFTPVKIGGKVLTDGGLVNPLPYDLIRDECDLLIAVDVSGSNKPDERSGLPSIFESIAATFQIMETALVSNQMEQTRPDIYIKPGLTNIQLMDFHKHEEIMLSGTRAAEKLREALNKKLRKRRFFI